MSDTGIARYLRLAVDDRVRRQRLATAVSQAISSGELIVEEARICQPDDFVTDILEFRDCRLAVVVDTQAPDRIAGVLTPFDLL